MTDNNDEYGMVDQVPQDFVNPVQVAATISRVMGNEQMDFEDIPLGVESDVQHVDLHATD
ncbi:MAG: hypothetical protein COB94_003190 [Gammaproteobacteria bacterium]|nr:hypothetical protein [Gammaproteobacteria bacterium]